MTTTKTTTKETTLVALATTNYHYYRHWVKAILSEGKIKTFRFKKNEANYDGVIMVDSKELVKAKTVLDNYTNKNPDIVEMFWF